MILSGQSIIARGIMHPCDARTRAFGMTHGVGPAGYDVTVEFDEEGTSIHKYIYPGSFILCSTIEQFTIPTDIMGIVHDKSSWARRGIAVQNTVIEPGWCGFLTLELTNHGQETIRLDRGMPIAQIVFHLLDKPANIPYNGKYQDQQRGPVKPIDEK